MKPRALFGALVRVLGVYFLVNIVFDVAYLACNLAGVPLGSTYPWQRNVLAIATDSLIGLTLFLGAEDIMRFAYREIPDVEEEVDRF